MGAIPTETANRARKALGKALYVPLGPAPFMPLVAVLWPRVVAQSFLYWSGYNKLTRADDGNAGKWAKRTKTQVMVSVPSLVQHNDEEPSVKGGRVHTPWKESWRQALFLSQDGSEFLSPEPSDTKPPALKARPTV